MAYAWTTPVRYIKTIGPTRAKELVACGISTVGDLLERTPNSYIFPGVVPIKDIKDGQVTIIKAKIVEIGRGWGSTVGALLDDGTATCRAVWYHGAWLLDNLRPGMTVTFWGKYRGGVLQQPKWCTHDGGMRSVYGGCYGEAHHATIRSALKEVLSNVQLPNMYDNDSRVACFRAYHFPASKDEQGWALATLKQDEAICLQLALAERRWGRERVTVEPMWCGTSEDFNIMGYFSYDFTKDQQTALGDILTDLTSRTTPMQRLIHGEVGSGKTAVAFYAAMIAALNGKRTLILCPTTILAQQHYDTLKGMGWDDVKLTHAGGSNETTEAHIIIGTHSILHADLLLKSASLVIIDEMQKWGVEQRAQATKHHPHLLLMSATPIPRSLAATVFGDLDVSVIRELPIRRGTVITKQVLPEKQDAMWDIIERELIKGHQVYTVFPRIDEDEDIVSAEQGFRESSKRFDQYCVKLLTGRASTTDKTGVMKDFKDGNTQILVSTVLAEVGLDNSNATVMCIMGADRFGLSSLHQMRGRICRSVDTAFCFLVSETSNPTSIARLEVIEKCNDGFEIAEHDLRLRGSGDVFSTRQHGLPDLKFMSLVDDYDLMIEAKEIVQAGSVGSGVREMMELKYGKSLELGGVV